jgi:hypothetical protein
MRHRLLFFLVTTVLFCVFAVAQIMAGPKLRWKIHAIERPHPSVINPGTPSTEARPGQPPSDAVILFDGSDLSKWHAQRGGPIKWKVVDGVIECVGGAGYIETNQGFGDCQLHIEWSAPVPSRGEGQGRGNSGVFLMGKYEIQVLDSYENTTYADGQAGAIYGQYPPMVNASRPPGQWQTYDVVFRRPRFNNLGQLGAPARMTVFHNGVLIQDNVTLWGPTDWVRQLPYEAHADKLPLALQDHSNPVRFRNIWIREIPEEEPSQEKAIASTMEKEITLERSVLDRYVGLYLLDNGDSNRVSRVDDHLTIHILGEKAHDIYAQSETSFFCKWLDMQIRFDVDDGDRVVGLTRIISGGEDYGRKVK